GNCKTPMFLLLTIVSVMEEGYVKPEDVSSQASPDSDSATASFCFGADMYNRSLRRDAWGGAGVVRQTRTVTVEAGLVGAFRVSLTPFIRDPLQKIAKVCVIWEMQGGVFEPYWCRTRKVDPIDTDA